MTQSPPRHRAPVRWRLLGSALAIVALALAVDALLNRDHGRCARFSREWRVQTRAFSPNEWGSCQYLNGRTWRSVHTHRPMRWLSWSSR